MRPIRPDVALSVRLQLSTEELRDSSLPEEYRDSDDFYPFDPYGLRHSSMFLQSRHRLYDLDEDDADGDWDEQEFAGGFHDRATAVAEQSMASACLGPGFRPSRRGCPQPTVAVHT